MTIWTMSSYNKKYNAETETWEIRPGYWTITNGHVSFDIHNTVNGGGKMQTTHPLREPGPEHWIVTPAEADAYAQAILDTLNAHPVSFTKRYWDNINEKSEDKISSS